MFLRHRGRLAFDWYVMPMRATGWHGGGSPTDPAGYGIKFSDVDRDRYFNPDWDHVVLELEGAEPATVRLSPSFWRRCSELRSANIGRWLLDQSAAPWAKGAPPRVAVDHLSENRFAARVLRRHVLPGPR